MLMTNSRDNSLCLLEIASSKILDRYEEENFINSNDLSRAGVAGHSKLGAVGSNTGAIIMFQIIKQKIELEEIYVEEHVE
jgi:hypothetical protein